MAATLELDPDPEPSGARTRSQHATAGEAAFTAARQAGLSSQELLENGIATFIDVSSIMVAYSIGMHESSLPLGIAYGFVDAFVVIWMRKRFARAARRLASLVVSLPPGSAGRRPRQ